jgi:tRNA G46 methylase TrmB
VATSRRTISSWRRREKKKKKKNLEMRSTFSENNEISEVGWGVGMDWIDLAQDRDRWRALVN